MRHPTTGPVLLLAGAGALLLLMGAAGTFAGLALAERIHALLPPITADAAAVGGAALALGGASFLAGAAHLGQAAVLARSQGEAALVSGIALCGVMAVLALGWSVAALVSAASGSAPAGGMLAAGIGLAVLSLAYGWAAARLMRLRRNA